MESRLGFIGIILQNSEASVEEVNRCISEFSDAILSRTGVPCREKEVAVITLTIEMDTDRLGKITGRLGNMVGVTVKSALVK